mgnify:CR=1 FL=1
MPAKGGLKFLRKRIRAIRNIRKVTKAMKAVSSVRLRKAQAIFLSSKEFLEDLEKKLLVSSLPPAEIQNSYESTFTLSSEGEEKYKLYIVLGTDRGLCGAFNSNIFRTFQQNFDEKNSIIWAFGKKISKLLRKYNIERKFEEFWRDFSYEKFESIFDEISEMIKSGKISDIYCIYMLFKSPGTQVPVSEKVFPVSVRLPWGPKTIFEPSLEKVLEFFSLSWLKAKLFACFQSSITSEHAARIKAMDLATQNADRLIKILNLQVNKARQEAITKELIDIVNGKNALEAQSI